MSLARFIAKFKRVPYYQNKPVSISVNDLRLGEADLPCYISRWPTVDEIDKQEDMEKYLSLICQRDTQKKLIMVSVTEKDKNYKMWLKALRKFKGVRIIPSTSIHHGHYKVWCVFLELHTTMKVTK